MNITTHHEALAALRLVLAGIDSASGNTHVLPATHELLTAVTDYGYTLDSEAAKRPRAPTLDEEDQPLYIDRPQMAVSALLLVEAGLQKAQDLTDVLAVTRSVLGGCPRMA